MAKEQKTLAELVIEYNRLVDDLSPHHHCHEVPETWDDDGTPCDLCIAWHALIAAAEKV